MVRRRGAQSGAAAEAARGPRQQPTAQRGRRQPWPRQRREKHTVLVHFDDPSFPVKLIKFINEEEALKFLSWRKRTGRMHMHGWPWRRKEEAARSAPANSDVGVEPRQRQRPRPRRTTTNTNTTAATPTRPAAVAPPSPLSQVLASAAAVALAARPGHPGPGLSCPGQNHA